MSVVCKLKDNQTYIFSKGSPEVMQSIMNQRSIPSNYKSKLREFASSGFRILAIGSKVLSEDWKNMSRDQLEADMEFNGF